ncbi:MAG: helix-turn-helix transcriptional regulator [Hyphomonadaceae bacterium]|nr:helix-turn-helix transcriptional regulator [Hyphomonadaceae bacterium]
MSAVTDTAGWPAFLAELARRTNASQAILLIEVSGTYHPRTILASSDGLISPGPYLGDEAGHATGALRSVVASRVSETATRQGRSDQVVQMTSRELVLHVSRPWGRSAILLTADDRAPPFDDAASKIVQQLEQEFAQASVAFATLIGLDDSTEVQAGTLTFFSGAVALVQGTGRILSQNPVWDVLFKRFPGFSPIQSPLWESTCRHAVRHGPQQVELAPGFCFRFSTIRHTGNDRTDILGAYAAERLVVEVLESPEIGHGRAALMRTYGLTGTETDILDWLKHGESVTQVAALRKCSVETIRHHLKSIKRKTGVSRLPSLVSLASSWLG